MPLAAETAAKAGQGAWVEVRLDRLVSNLRLLKKEVSARTGAAPQVMAVVKANAYGHGLIETARALSGEAAYLGVSSLYEILELRERGIQTPLFLFGRLFGAEMATAVKSGAAMSVTGFDDAAEISEISESMVVKTPVHIKVDTGMGRLGIPVRRAEEEIARIAELPGIYPEGIFTHFPSAEKADGFAEEQLELFQALLRRLESKGIRFRFRHAANSAGNLRISHPAMQDLNLMRPGLILYGISPDKSLGTNGFEPVLALKSRIILSKRIKAGETVGYGRTFTASRECTIATLPIGYSHGYPFHLSNKSWVLYKGKKYPLAGRVSMDYLTVDLGDENARAGDEVTLLGDDKGASITAADLAGWAGTIPYEIVTRLSSRLPRFYFS